MIKRKFFFVVVFTLLSTSGCELNNMTVPLPPAPSSTEPNTNPTGINESTEPNINPTGINENTQPNETPKEPSMVSAPADLSVEVSAPQALRLRWQPVPDASGYQVYLNGEHHATLGAEQTDYNFEQLDVELEYDLGVRTVVGQSTSVLSEVLQKKPLWYVPHTVPAQVTGLQITQISDTGFTLSWEKPYGDVRGYHLELNGKRVEMPYHFHEETSYTFSELTPDTDYTVRVVAITASIYAEGEWSELLSVTTQPSSEIDTP